MNKNKRGGRPSKYKPIYCKKIIEYFTVENYKEVVDKYTYKDGTVKETIRQVANNLPLFEGFAFKIKICVDTLHEWRQKHPEFSEAYKMAQYLQKQMLIQNGLLGLYQAAPYIFTAKNIAGMRDQVVLAGDKENPLFKSIERIKMPVKKPAGAEVECDTINDNPTESDD